jgi:DNA-binding response OmpR family regulator
MFRQRETILVIQADQDNREMYAEYLQRQGFTPLLARTAREGLRLADSGNVDAIVTGVLLPGEMDGVELVQELKRDDRTARIPVVVLTTCSWSSERIRAEHAGCALFLGKPCLPERLVEGLRRVLAGTERNERRRFSSGPSS